MPDVVETKLFQEPWDVDRRLAELELGKVGLLRAVAASRAERLNATNFHPANAAGTFSYHYGVAALRQEFVGYRWAIDRSDGVEAMRNEELSLRGLVSERRCGLRRSASLAAIREGVWRRASKPRGFVRAACRAMRLARIKAPRSTTSWWHRTVLLS